MLRITTGCREGEMLALAKEDIEFENNLIHIRKTYYREKGIDYITTPKTEKSVRTIVIPDFLKQELKEYCDRLYEYPNGKPHLTAIAILSDIVYWHRPREIRDECTGQIIGYKKKLQEDMLQRNYQQISELFGISKKQATAAIDFLQKLGVI